MTYQNTLIIDVFSNEEMTKILGSYSDDGDIFEIEDDLCDGEDWWQFYADEAEEQYGSNWSKIFIRSDDGTQGRVLDRNYCLTGEINNHNFTYHDKLFLIGEASSINLSSCFSEHIILNYQLNKINSSMFYHKGKDEAIISLIKSFTAVMFDKAKIVDVIYNPTPQSILAMKLSEQYKYMIHIPTKDKLNELIGLEKARYFSSRIYHELLAARRITQGYSTTQLNFILPLIDDIENKIDFRSENSFFKIFEKKFCI